MKDLSESAKKAMVANFRGTSGQVSKSLKAIAEGKPFNAEDEEDRKVKRVKAELPELSMDIIKGIVSYDESILGAIPKKERAIIDSLIGTDKSKDYLGVAYLEVAQAAAKCVGRIIYKSNRQPAGTGFLISDDLFITNQHVVDDTIVAKQVLVEFNYELNAFGHPKEAETFELDPEKFFLCAPSENLDFSIVGVKKQSSKKLSKYGFCPLSDATDKHAKGDYATIIQHPFGSYKQIALRENRLVARLDDPPVLHYVSDTEHGSSGSPVFDDQWRVIGLHRGECQSSAVYPDGTDIPSWIKEAARASGIVKYIKDYLEKNRKEFSQSQFALINRALKCGFSRPSLIVKAKQN